MRRSVVSLLVAAGLLTFNATAVMAAPPPNDRFANATVIGALPFESAINTAEAAGRSSEPDCGNDAHTVWYRFTPSEAVNVTASTFGSDFDTTLSVWVGDSLAELEQLRCSDDEFGFTSAVRFQATAGTTYYLLAGSFDGSPGGNLVLNVREFAAPTLEVTVRRAVVDTRVGDVRVRGTIICENAIVASISVHLRQVLSSGAINSGDGAASLRCDGTTQVWKTLVLGGHAFFPGWARVIATTDACSEFACAFDRLTRVIRLRPL
jgi:hypothetical protein